MPLFYACVAKDSSVLADTHDNVEGNFEVAVQQLLDRTDSSKYSRHTYNLTTYSFHVVCKDTITFLAISDQEFARRIAFAFLEKVQDKFLGGPLAQRAVTAKPYELRRDFSPVLSSALKEFNKTRDVDGLSDMRADVEEVKGIMSKNIETIIERGDNLHNLQKKTSDLEHGTNRFHRNAVRLRRKMWWQNAKLMVTLTIVTLLIISIVTLIILWQNGVFKKK